MRMVNAIIGFLLLTLAMLHAFIPNHMLFASLYGLGACLAFSTMRFKMRVLTARVLAVLTTGLMFFYFAGFFRMATYFTDTWYQSGAALEGIAMLLSAFAMIPILSSFSCILKADETCELHKRATDREPAADRRSPAFFRVPEGVQEKSVG